MLAGQANYPRGAWKRLRLAHCILCKMHLKPKAKTISFIGRTHILLGAITYRLASVTCSPYKKYRLSSAFQMHFAKDTVS